MVLVLCAMYVCGAVAHAAGARGWTLGWSIILGNVPVALLLSVIMRRLFPPVTVAEDYRSILFSDRDRDAENDRGRDGQSQTVSSPLVMARELDQRQEVASEPSLLPVLDLSELGPAFGRVRDVRHRVNTAADTSPQSWLLSWALPILAMLFLLISLVMSVAALPFELILRVVTRRRGLVIGPVRWLLSAIVSPISGPLTKGVKDRKSCPLCGQQGTVDRVVDVTDTGNTRVSILGFESSVADSGRLNLEHGERLTISQCQACLEHFVEGPFPD